MKICPQCQSKYTDDTLKFCLQDGSKLTSQVDEKTLYLNQDSLSNEETIAENFVATTPNKAQETVAFTNQATNRDALTNNLSKETVLSRREISEPTLVVNNESIKSGSSFLTGLVIGVLLIGLLGAGIIGVIYLPTYIGNNTDANLNNNTNTDSNTAKTISDSDLVKVSASSTRESDKGNNYNPSLAFDGNSRTAWCEGATGAGKGQWIVFDFKDEVNLKKINIQPGYFKTAELWRKNNRLASVVVSFSDRSSRIYSFPDEMKEQKIDVGNVKTKSVMISIKEIYAGQSDSKDTLISEVSFVVE